MIGAKRLTELRFPKKEVKIQNLPVSQIRPNPYQPRKVFDKAALEELSASIQLYGVMQPIQVRLINGCSYELISGERRLRAAKMAGLSTIPSIVVQASDNDSAFIALIENLQRQNLNFLEEAEGYYNIMNDYHITQEELAAKLGKNQSTIANKLRILKLPEEIKRMILDHGLTERHARALLKIPAEQTQREVLETVIGEDLNVKKTEELVQQTLERLRTEKKNLEDQKEKRSMGDIRLFTNTIKQSLAIMKKSGLNAAYHETQSDDFYEIHIKIPKEPGLASLLGPMA